MNREGKQNMMQTPKHSKTMNVIAKLCSPQHSEGLRDSESQLTRVSTDFHLLTAVKISAHEIKLMQYV